MLLTAAHVIGALFPMTTDETAVVGYGDPLTGEHDTATAPLEAIRADIGEVARSIPPDRSQKCTIDAALARVSSNRSLGNQFNGHPVVGVRNIAEDLGTNVPVHMFGARSNMRSGVLNTAPVTERLQIGKSEHSIMYERACYIESLDDRPFADMGDSGSIVIDEDNYAVAMVVGLSSVNLGGPPRVLATPLAPALDALEVALYEGEGVVSTPRVSPVSE